MKYLLTTSWECGTKIFPCSSRYYLVREVFQDECQGELSIRQTRGRGGSLCTTWV